MTNTQEQITIEQIEARKARGKQFLCSLLGDYEVTGTSPREWAYGESVAKRGIWTDLTRKARALKKIGLEPKYVTIDETLVDTFDNCSRTYAYCAILLRDLPETELALHGGKLK